MIASTAALGVPFMPALRKLYFLLVAPFFSALLALSGCTSTLNPKVITTASPKPLILTTTSLPAATVGAAYSSSVVASGGTTPYGFSASGLPSGLSIVASTGAISGTPAANAAGTYLVAISVTDVTSPTALTASATLSLTVNPGSNPLTISTTSLPAATVDAAYSTFVAASGGTTPYSFSVSGLPLGLSISASTGAISGTPETGSAGTDFVTIGGTDSTVPIALTASTTLSLTVNPAVVTPPPAGTCKGMSLGASASLNGYVPFPASNVWNTDISSAPLDPDNTLITTEAGFAGLHLHHNFTSVAGGNAGMPYIVVDSSVTPLVPINVIDYASQSDVTYAPYPIDAPIEDNNADCLGWPDTYEGDAHVLVLDRATCTLYETYNTHRCNGAWNASSETIWDMDNYEQRPWGWTSADAAGLPIFPGLIRYDEILGGAINHAIRFTMQQTKHGPNDRGYFVYPASHAAGTSSSINNIMGMRVRLKAGFDISGYSTTNQIILTAMKKYGMILADNGSYFFFEGVADPRWNDNDLENLDSIQSSNFDVVEMSPAFPGYNSASAPTGLPPTIGSFTASPSTVAAGSPVTLTWTTTNDSYDFIDKLGAVRGGTLTFTPPATATYTLNATNQYGRSTQQLTVTVQ
jgi:hypothetical protein